MFTLLNEENINNIKSLRPPNRQNKKRRQRRSVERFQAEVVRLVCRILKTKYSRSLKDEGKDEIF